MILLTPHSLNNLDLSKLSKVSKMTLFKDYKLLSTKKVEELYDLEEGSVEKFLKERDIKDRFFVHLNKPEIVLKD